MAYDDLKDSDYSQTRVKKTRKSNGRKGNVPPKTYTVPDLINEGDTYPDHTAVKVGKQQTSGGIKAGWRPRASNATQTPEGQNVKYQPVKPASRGRAAIDELPGQMTGPVPVPKKPGAPKNPSKGK